ncbi:MAG: TAXI family TRAP transporter solute-binding subunit, partial [Pseudomonadota bacterium]|nr:TAXI family TRAP transporter solute-binding subunit [Pseudomonadota bacterium]
AFLQITETEEIRFVGPADDTGEAVDKALGKYRYRDTIPTGLYSGQMNEAPVQTFNTAVGIVVNADVPEDTVYRITKAFWENVDSVTSTAPWAASLDPQFGGTLQGSGISLHPGAMKYYKEIGVQ